MQSISLRDALTSDQNLWPNLGAECTETTSCNVDIPVPCPQYPSLWRKAVSWFAYDTPNKKPVKRFIRLICSLEENGVHCSATLRNGAPPVSLSINQFHKLRSSKEKLAFSILEEQSPINSLQNSLTETCSTYTPTLPKPFFLAKTVSDLFKLFEGRKDIRWKKTTKTSCSLSTAKENIIFNEKKVTNEKGQTLTEERAVTVFENGDFPFSFPATIVRSGAIDTTGSDSSDVTKDFLEKTGIQCTEKKHDGLSRHICAINEKALNRVWPAKWKVIYWKKRYKIPTYIYGICALSCAIFGLLINHDNLYE